MSTSTVPERPHTRADLRLACAESCEPSLASPLILIAEDDDDIRLMMRTLLEMKGYRVSEAENGQRALTVAEAESPDLILVDLQLPRLNGFAVTRFVRQHEGLKRVPIVVVSAHEPAKHMALALAAGSNAYLQKPIDFDQLDQLLQSLLAPESCAQSQQVS